MEFGKALSRLASFAQDLRCVIWGEEELKRVTLESTQSLEGDQALSANPDRSGLFLYNASSSNAVEIYFGENGQDGPFTVEIDPGTGWGTLVDASFFTCFKGEIYYRFQGQGTLHVTETELLPKS